MAPKAPKKGATGRPLRLLAIGDIHFRWRHRKALEWALRVARNFRPTVVAQLGDVYDRYSWSRFPRDFSVTGPEEEEDEARLMAEDFFGELARATPDAEGERHITPGNHDLRPYLRAMEKNPESAFIIKAAVKRSLTFPGFRTASLDSPEVRTHNRILAHGHTRAGAHAVHNQMSTWVAHSHTGGVLWFRNLRGVYFEANAGYLGDEDAPVFNYAPFKTVKKGTLGVGLEDETGPRFMPYRGGK